MNKRGFTILLALMAMGATLTLACACGDGNDTEPPVTPPGEITDPVTPPDGDEKESATISVNVENCVYDGTNRQAVVSVSPSDAGTLSIVYQCNESTVTECVNAGSYTVTVSLQSETHEAATVEKSFTISPKPLTVTGVTTTDKYQDGNASVSYTGTPALEGVIEGDDVTVSSFALSAADNNYGVCKPVTAEITLGGEAVNNYTVQPVNLTVNFYPVTADFKFMPTIEGNGVTAYTAAEYIGEANEIIIPDTFDKVPVTAVANECFVDNTALTKVTFSPNVAANAAAFAGCTSLNSVILANCGFEFRPTFEENAITKFAAVGFGGMGADENVVVPSSVGGAPVTKLNDHLFAGNDFILSLTVPDSVTEVGLALAQNATKLKTVVFEDREDTIVWGTDQFGAWTFAGSSVEEITIGKGVTEIPAIFATGAVNLQTVSFGSDVAIIGSEAFKNCTALNAVALSQSLTEIRFDAFRGSGLQSVTVPARVEQMGTAVFQDCASLETVVFEDRQKTIAWGLGNLEGSWMFFGCAKLSDITIGDGITTLPKIFAPTAAKNVRLGKDVATLGDESFPNAQTVTALYLASQTVCDALASHVFFGNVTTLYLADGVTATEYITTNFTAGASEGGYTQYTKNQEA